MSAGAVTVAATDQRLAELSTVEIKDGIHVHYCAAKRTVENFQWRSVKLDFGPSPGPGPVVGAELVIPFVASLIANERARLPIEERRCFFCAETVALDDEYFAWHYRSFGWNYGAPTSHLVVVAHFCSRARCEEEKEMWLATVRAKPPGQVIKSLCAQCHAVAEPGTKYLACGGCLTVNYCSVECQRRHRAVHRAFCESVVKKTKKEE